MAGTIWTGRKKFTVPENGVVPIPAPHRGIIRGYTLEGVLPNGASHPPTVGGQVYLFTSREAIDLAAGDVVNNNTFDSALILEFDASGPFASNRNLNLAYTNTDGTPTNPQGFLYLHLPQSVGKECFFTITIETPTLQ